MKILKTVSVLILWLFATSLVEGQAQKITIADGTEVKKEAPLNYSTPPNYYRKAQMIYPSEMLGAFINSKITKVTFHVRGNVMGTVKYDSAQVILDTTISTSLTNAWASITAGVTPSYSGTVSVLSSGGVSSVNIALATPFVYTGNNLLIDMQNTKLGNAINLNSSVFYFGMNRTGGSRHATATAYPNTLDGTAIDFLPKVTFEYEPLNTPRTITATVSGNGTVNFSGTYTFATGAMPMYVIIPDVNNKIQSVKLDNQDITSQFNLAFGGAYTFPALDNNHTLEVTFVPDPTKHTVNANATEVHSTFPFSFGWMKSGSPYFENQVIYDASTLTSMLGDKIKSITFYRNGDANGTCDSAEVFIGHTLVPDLKDGLVSKTGLTEVYSGAIALTQPTGVGNRVLTVTFDKEFTYRGGNLVIYMRNLGRGIDNPQSFYCVSSPKKGWQTSTEYNAVFGDAPAISYAVDYLPKIQFDLERQTLPAYTITSLPATNGTISPTGVVTFAEGATPTYTLTPKEYHKIEKVLVNGTEVEAKISSLTRVGTYTFPPVKSNDTIKAFFIPLPQYTVTIISENGGSIVSANGLDLHYEGTSPKYRITPDEGFAIDSVFVDGVLEGIGMKSYTFISIAEEGHTIRATFKKSYTNIVKVANCDTSTSYAVILTQAFASAGRNVQNQIIYQASDLQELPIGAQIVRMTFQATNYQNAHIGYNKATVNLVPTEQDIFETKNSPYIEIPEGTSAYVQNLELENSNMSWYFNGDEDVPFIYEGGNLLVNTVTEANGITTDIAYPYIAWCAAKRTGASHVMYNVYGIGDQISDLPQVTIEYRLTYKFSAEAGDNGNITPEGEHIYGAGHRQTFVITPDKGYDIDTVLLNGEDITTQVIKNEDGTYSYTSEPLEENAAISVSFKLVEYTITYYNVNGADSTVNPAVYTVETPTFSLNPLTKVGHVFDGWYSNAELTVPAVSVDLGSTGNKEFWAKWEDNGGVVNNEIQNVRVYAYMNTVYIVNEMQIPLKSVEITDITGRVVYRSSSVQSPISLNVAEGQYMVRLMSNDNVLNTKVMIR